MNARGSHHNQEVLLCTDATYQVVVRIFPKADGIWLAFNFPHKVLLVKFTIEIIYVFFWNGGVNYLLHHLMALEASETEAVASALKPQRTTLVDPPVKPLYSCIHVGKEIKKEGEIGGHVGKMPVTFLKQVRFMRLTHFEKEMQSKYVMRW